nr:MAG TPA: hypothetical protein [Caudoviricetes sp.]
MATTDYTLATRSCLLVNPFYHSGRLLSKENCKKQPH